MVSRSTIHRRTFACLLLLVVVCSSLFPKSGDAAAASPWLTDSEPSLKKLGMLDANFPLTADITGNQDCQPAEVITRPERLLPPQSKQSHDSCIVDTGFGALSASGYLQRQGSDAFGFLWSPIGNQAVVGIPHTNNALASVASSAHGVYVGFYDNLRGLVSSSTFSDTVTHTLPNNPSAMIADHAGNKLGVDFSSLSFSSEGEWAVMEAPGVAMLRINTASHQVLPFADAPILENTGPAYRTAISADGRSAVVVSKTRSLFRLYDLSTCAAIPDTITSQVACQSVDLLPFIKSRILGYTSVASVRFRGDYTLEAYINTTLGIEHDLVTAAGQAEAHFEYLAMGDSFASGEGAYQYKASTDTTANGCHVSLRSYPYLIAKRLPLSQMESIACSGATVNDLINGTADYRLHQSQARGKEDASFDDGILRDFLAGYRAQKTFSRKYTPQVITVSIGGNDVGFSDILQRCLGPDTCYAHYEDRLELLNEISAQFNKLTSAFAEIKHSTPESKRIYIVGYPQIADPFGNCALNVHLNYDELILASTLVSHLNSVLKNAADHAGVTYLDTEDALHGHRLCETNANGIAVNGLTIGNDILNFPYIHGPIAKESFHPNSLGHELLTSKLLSLTGNFSALNTAPKPDVKTKLPNLSADALKAPKANRPTRKVIHRSSDNPSPAKKKTKRVSTTKAVVSIFKPGTKPQVLIDGTGDSVGVATPNPDDSMTVELTPPDTATDGPHTLDIVGENTSGEPTSVTETIVIGDSNGQCGTFAASNIDSDHDGIDDACDPLIGSSQESPPTTPVTVNTGSSSSTNISGQGNLASDSTTTAQLAPLIPTLPIQAEPTIVLQGSAYSPATPKLATTPITTTARVSARASPKLAVMPSVKGEKTSINSRTPINQGRFPPATTYKNPPKLDVVKLRNLFMVFVVCLIIAYLVHKRRKDRP